MDAKVISGFALTGFRSFGPQPQYVAPLGRVNIFAGKNNVGKSNILRFLHHLDKSRLVHGSLGNPFANSRDFHRGKRQAQITMAFPLWSDQVSMEELMSTLGVQAGQVGAMASSLRSVFSRLSCFKDGAVWFTFDPTQPGTLIGPISGDIVKLTKGDEFFKARSAISQLWSIACNRHDGNFEAHHVPQLLDRIAKEIVPRSFRIFDIGTHRQVGKPGSKYDLNGSGIIEELVRLQNPELDDREQSLAKFRRINEFVKTVTGATDARLEIPHSKEQLLVELDGRLLPIESLGTGIQQVVIFAASATTLDDSIVCIEEPETHLHPRLQRSLLRYLRDSTTNTYFITTHSASLLDAPGVALFHVRLNDYDETEVDRLDKPSGRAYLGNELGYHASDLVQSNSIVWVEGPSDRIYVNAWLRNMAPELEEGVHYSIMFYGGRLLAHLSANDESVEEFISLQRLNRHVAILIDSDKRSPTQKINDTKLRVADEIRRSKGFAWITFGREVENYIKQDVISSALVSVHPRMSFKSPRSEIWSCRYESLGKKFSVDKIELARRVVQKVEFDSLDLREKVEGLAAFIRNANS